MNDQQTPERDWAKFVKDLGWWIALLVGLVSGVIFWYYPREERPQPAYLIDPSRATIVRASSGFNALKVFYNDRPIAGEDVNVLTYYFWNSGGHAIQATEIRAPYVCNFSKGVEVLDVHIARTTREVTRFSASKLSSTSIQLKFDFIEKGDGAAIQVIYSGPVSSQLRCAGTAIGAEDPKLREPETEEHLNALSNALSNSTPVPVRGVWVWLSPAIVAFFSTITFWSVVKNGFDNKSNDSPRRRILRVTSATGGVIVIIAMWGLAFFFYERQHQLVQYVVPDSLRQPKS